MKSVLQALKNKGYRTKPISIRMAAPTAKIWGGQTVSFIDLVKKLETPLRVMIFNLASASWDSGFENKYPFDKCMTAQANYIKEKDPDVVLLQEVWQNVAVPVVFGTDGPFCMGQRVDQAAMLSKKTGMPFYYYGHPDWKYWGGYQGLAILSKWYVVGTPRVITVAGSGIDDHDRIITEVQIRIGETTLTLVDVHAIHNNKDNLGNSHDQSSKRVLYNQKLVELYGDKDFVIIGGDFNSATGFKAQEMQVMASKFRWARLDVEKDQDESIHEIDSDLLKLYIFFRGPFKVKRYADNNGEGLPSTISDHEIIYTDLIMV